MRTRTSRSLVGVRFALVLLLVPVAAWDQTPPRPKSTAGQNWEVTVLSVQNTGQTSWRQVTSPLDVPRYQEIPKGGLVFWRLKVEVRRKQAPDDAEFDSQWIQVRYRDKSGTARQEDIAAVLEKDSGGLGQDDVAAFGRYKLWNADPRMVKEFLFVGPQRVSDVVVMSVTVLDYPEVQVLP